MENFSLLVKSEVAAISAFVISFLALLPVMGVDISAEQTGGIVSAVTIVLGFFTRSSVTSQKGLIKRDIAVGEYLKSVAANK
jgi:Na+-translocating ferredoxin:NAD+ oxidoreductase RnfA subunit